MAEPAITLEPISDDLVAACAAAGLARGLAGRAALDWAFRGNPLPFAVARQDGAIVGLSAYILAHTQFGDQQGLAVQAVDSFVLESMRGKGLFTRLARAYDAHAAEVGLDLVWGFPNNNAAPAWFGKLDWHRHGQTPFLIKPLRAGFFARKLGLTLDVKLTTARDQGLVPVTEIGVWADDLWERMGPAIGVGTIRDRAFLQHRLCDAPQAHEYRIVASTDSRDPAILGTREADKHGGRIGYVMEALGGPALQPLLMSELGRMAARGVEIALAWSYPWSPGYSALRRAGFFPLPERFRPIRIWFGTRPKSAKGAAADIVGQWYLSYLDSDTV
jgi:hypothetical protein